MASKRKYVYMQNQTDELQQQTFNASHLHVHLHKVVFLALILLNPEKTNEIRSAGRLIRICIVFRASLESTVTVFIDMTLMNWSANRSMCHVIYLAMVNDQFPYQFREKIIFFIEV